MVADQRKMGRAIFFENVITLEIIVGIAPYLEHRRTLGTPSIFHTWCDLGVTSRDLSVTYTVFQKLWRKWTLSQKLLGLEWYNLGKS